MKRTLLVVAAVLLAAVQLVACGDDDSADREPTSSGEDGLPPDDALDLRPLYGDALAEVGMRLTDRGGLIDTSGGGYEPSPTGRHLALYVEPIDSDAMSRSLEAGRRVTLDQVGIFADGVAVRTVGGPGV